MSSVVATEEVTSGWCVIVIARAQGDRRGGYRRTPTVEKYIVEYVFVRGVVDQRVSQRHTGLVSGK